MQIYTRSAEESGALEPNIMTAPSARNVVPITSDTDSRQWTIKGIPSDTVEISRDAARRSGMKLNAWVGSALLKAADKQSDEHHDNDATQNIDLSKRVSDLEDYIKSELAMLREIREKSESIEATMKGISVLIAKLYSDTKAS